MKFSLDKFGELDLVNYLDLNRDEQLFILKMRNHSNVRKWMYSKDEISEREHLEFMRTLSSQNSDKKYLVVKKNNDIIGVIYFTNTDFVSLESNIGFFSNQFNKSPMSAFILEKTLIQYAFKELELKKIKAEVLLDNKSVIKLHEKFGFSIVTENESVRVFMLENEMGGLYGNEY